MSAGLLDRPAATPLDLDGPMRALSLWQPWATLAARGLKTAETRSWQTAHRGLLALHASKHVARLDEARACWDVLGVDAYTATRATEAPTRFPEGEQVEAPLPLGAVLATAHLVDVVPIVASTEDLAEGYEGRFVLDVRSTGLRVRQVLSVCVASRRRGCRVERSIEEERGFGDYTPGRFAWLLEDLRELPEPVPAKGHQGLWWWRP